MCAYIPHLHSATRVLVLQHPSEQRHALNTARLAALGLANAELLVGEVFSDLQAHLVASGRRALLLFPGDHSVALSNVEPAGEAGDLLVVPDGTWRKARKLLYMNPCLLELPRVTLPIGGRSRYRLRKAPSEDALSTLEAVVGALNVLEQPQRFDALLEPFERLIDGQISAMGHDVYLRNHASSIAYQERSMRSDNES
ncbi:DTW domain-containing protein [Pseudomonas matsuisoli]|uniref:tRNA-uridine aminocarboxypropyltransferase n=1 Tax=Pseudomonas matsuisoli TaxID=1515666 RepID=A0A917UU61_9PSED|nr:DTW domain-containing protein [Pseudomonas matsuisoli]